MFLCFHRFIHPDGTYPGAIFSHLAGHWRREAVAGYSAKVSLQHRQGGQYGIRTIEVGKEWEGLDPALPTVAVCGAGRALWIGAGPSVVQLGPPNRTYGSVAILPPSTGFGEMVIEEGEVESFLANPFCIAVWKFSPSSARYKTVVVSNRPAFPRFKRIAEVAS